MTLTSAPPPFDALNQCEPLSPFVGTTTTRTEPHPAGHVEALHRLILEECWRPAFARYLHVRFTGLKRDLAQYLDDYNFDRPHHGRLTQGRIPGDIVYGARKVKTR